MNKINIDIVEYEILKLMRSSSISRESAKYIIWSSLTDEQSPIEYANADDKDLIVSYVNPNRVLH